MHDPILGASELDVLAFLSDPGNDFPPVLTDRVDRLLQLAQPLVASSRSDVVLSSLARLCVPGFSDACSVEIHTPDAPFYRIRYPRERQRLRHGASASNRFDAAEEFGSMVRVAVTRPPTATFGPTYQGEVVFVWTEYRAGRGDKGLAELLVRHAVQVIERRRLADALDEAQSVTDRMRAAIGIRREIDLARHRLQATGLAEHEGDRMLQRAGAENSELLEDLADEAGSDEGDSSADARS